MHLLLKHVKGNLFSIFWFPPFSCSWGGRILGQGVWKMMKGFQRHKNVGLELLVTIIVSLPLGFGMRIWILIIYSRDMNIVCNCSQSPQYIVIMQRSCPIQHQSLGFWISYSRIPMISKKNDTNGWISMMLYENNAYAWQRKDVYALLKLRYIMSCISGVAVASLS